MSGDRCPYKGVERGCGGTAAMVWHPDRRGGEESDELPGPGGSWDGEIYGDGGRANVVGGVVGMRSDQ